MSAEEICSRLKLEHRTAWSVGERTRLLNGQLSDGIRESSYCSFPLREVQSKQPDHALSKILGMLSRRRKVLESLQESGAKLELIVGVMCNFNCSFRLDYRQAERFALLGIDVVLDIYG